MAIINIGYPFIQTSGLAVLRESRIKIYNAFALGRLALTEFRYEEVQRTLAILLEQSYLKWLQLEL